MFTHWALSLAPQFLFLLRQNHPWSHVFWLLYFFLFNVFCLFLNISLIFFDFFSKSLFFSNCLLPRVFCSSLCCYLVAYIILFLIFFSSVSTVMLSSGSWVYHPCLIAGIHTILSIFSSVYWLEVGRGFDLVIHVYAMM